MADTLGTWGIVQGNDLRYKKALADAAAAEAASMGYLGDMATKTNAPGATIPATSTYLHDRNQVGMDRIAGDQAGWNAANLANGTSGYTLLDQLAAAYDAYYKQHKGGAKKGSGGGKAATAPVIPVTTPATKFQGSPGTPPVALPWYDTGGGKRKVGVA